VESPPSVQAVEKEDVEAVECLRVIRIFGHLIFIKK